MIFLGVLALFGKSILMVPLPKRMIPKLEGGDAKSVFLLGVFSGAATSCCAPVLAGAVMLAVISGVFWKALIVTFAYVFGITFPLFIGAYFYDRFHIEKFAVIRGRIFQLKLFGSIHTIHSTNLLAGIVFFAVGVLLIVLALSGNAFWAPSFQGEISSILNKWSQDILGVLGNMPDTIWGIIILGIFFFLVYRVFSRKGNSQD